MRRDLLVGTSLRDRARGAIADDHLGAALERATDRFAMAKIVGPATIANYEELRDAARAIRHRNMQRLPDLLDEFADNVERRGGHVCWAATADEANAYVAELARRRGVRRVVKSKSMATEEIHLNDALESLGMEVTETDLGEWIVQLADEPPSHIVGPAVHKTRGDVARLFEPLGHDGSDVPEDLTAFARTTLRERFLAADMGVSGVNFGIAASGSIVVVTNEGNGRLCTSLPPVHVAVMGMERILASFDELDVLLALLTRQAAGQEITSYVNVITGPRGAGEVDGPEELHLVILDNGRSDVLGTELEEILHCIRCGACLNVCPVYRQIGGHAYGWVYSGPVGAVLTPLLHRATEAGELSEASSLCGACYDACPVRIPLQDLLLALRRRRAPQAPAATKAAWQAWAATWSRPSLYRASTRSAATVSRMLPEALAPSGWTDGRTLPRADGEPFRRWIEDGS